MALSVRSAVVRFLLLGIVVAAAACSARDDSGNEPSDIESDYAACVPACDGRECGDDGCGGKCGNCPQAAPICTDAGLCVVTCLPACDGKEYGPDGCGGTCGNCPQAAPYCGDSGMCNTQCAPSCSGRECGDDGCGGSCGQCPAAAPICSFGGVCQQACAPDCSGKQCGDDGCNGSCGLCPDTTPYCQPDGSCAGMCNPNCVDKVCGDDGCGGSCGQCPGSSQCAAGACVDPACLTKNCGPGGTCSVVNGQALCQCSGPAYDWGQGCELAQFDYLLIGDVQFNCTNETSGLLAALGTGTFRLQLGFNTDPATEGECMELMPPYQMEPCVEIPTTIANFALLGSPAVVSENMSEIIGQSFGIRILANGDSAHLSSFEVSSQPDINGFYYTFVLYSASLPLTISNGQPVWGPFSIPAGTVGFMQSRNGLVSALCEASGALELVEF